MSQFGRISGPLLAGNLLRNGTDLAFETSQLYLNVTGRTLGINTTGPSNDLTVGTIKNDGTATTSTIQTVNLINTATANIGNFTVATNTFQHLTSSINIVPNPSSNPTTVTPGLSTSSLYFSGNTLVTTVANDNVNISPNGTGQIAMANTAGTVQVTVNANLHAQGNITFDGNVTLGNQTTNLISFAAEVNSNILPSTAAAYDLGSSSLQWNAIYATTLNASASGVTSAISSTTSNIGNFTISGNTVLNASNNASLLPSGTGLTKFNNINYLYGSTISNPLNTAFSLNSTNNGYIKFTGSSGTVIPTGTTSTRPTNPEIGTTRYNTTITAGEVYNGTAWIPIGGTSAVLSQSQVTDIMWAWDLTLG
jgi:hypothetical protein